MLILDSQAAVWWVLADARLSQLAMETIRAGENVNVSVASLWELEIKRAKGKFDGPRLDDVLRGSSIDFLDITAADATAAAHLPPHHGDPFDRMIVAQSVLRGARLVTSDSALAAYEVPIIW